MNKLIFLIGVCFYLTHAYSQIREDPATIEEEIKNLQEQLDHARLKNEQQTVDSQKEIIADWPKYSQKIEEIKKTQDQMDALKKEVQELELKKAQLLKKTSPFQNEQE